MCAESATTPAAEVVPLLSPIFERRKGGWAGKNQLIDSSSGRPSTGSPFLSSPCSLVSALRPLYVCRALRLYARTVYFDRLIETNPSFWDGATIRDTLSASPNNSKSFHTQRFVLSTPSTNPVLCFCTMFSFAAGWGGAQYLHRNVDREFGQ